MKKLGLIWRIVIAIVLAIVLGTVLPMVGFGIDRVFGRVFATFNVVFGQFLGFVVPLIIIGFITPSIAKLGKGSGKLLGIATAVAYTSTVLAGIFAFLVASNLLPNFISSADKEVSVEGAREALSTFIDIELPPVMGIMTALLLAFLLGIGMAAIKGDVMSRLFDELNEIVEKTISVAIIPLLPFHIFGIFYNMTYTGEVGRVLTVFAMVFVMIIILHWIMLAIQYTTAGSMAKKSPLFLLKTMAPAYFTALGTQSSAATIPVTLRQAKKTGASEKITDFTIPLFATIHLSGSTITIVSTSIGVMLMYGMDVAMGSFVPFIFMLGVAMIAAPGVPGGAIVAASGFLVSMLGFDQEMVALMVALYLAQDSFGTATNVTGDGALSVIVDSLSKK